MSAEEWNCSSSSGNFTRANDCQLGGEILLAGDLSIFGRHGLTTVIAKADHRHFSLSTETLSLTYLNLTGGKSGNGGSIFVDGSGGARVVIRFCSFCNNRADYGGSIYGWDKSSITIYDSNITDSVAKYRGGGLYMNEGAVNLTRVLFRNNKQQQSGVNFDDGGGAVYAVYSSNLQIRESSFVGNYAKNQGHVLMTHQSDENGSPSVTVVNTRFKPCDACTDWSQTSFYSYKNVSQVAYAQNLCSAGPCSLGPYTGTCRERKNFHGVLCLPVSTCTLGNSAFFELGPTMSAACRAGWDCVTSLGTFNRTDDCQLGEEIVLSGNLEIVGRKSLTKITSAPKSRHFTVLNGNELVLKWVNLTGGNILNLGSCTTTPPPDAPGCGFGGAVYAEDSKLFIEFCAFYGNRAFRGGAIATKNAQSFSLTSTSFTSNVGGQCGGAVYVYFEQANPKTINFDRLNFSNNSIRVVGTGLTPYGGALYCTGGRIEMQNSLFLKNVLMDNDGTSGAGGAVWAKLNITIVNSHFIGNRASEGGAIYLMVGRIHVLDSLFKANVAIHQGGGIRIFGNEGKGVHLTVERVDFIENQVIIPATSTDGVYGGGAIWVKYYDTTAEIKVTDSRFLKNEASHGLSSDIPRGGAIFALCAPCSTSHVKKLNVRNTTFDKNKAGRGGAVYIKGHSTLNLYRSNVVTNEAYYGGGIFAYSDVVVNVNDSGIQNNSANYMGGGLYFDTVSVNFYDSVIASNAASAKGGGIMAHGSTVVFNQATVRLNRQSNDDDDDDDHSDGGGGVYTSSLTTLIFRESVLDRNYAKGKGNQIFVFVAISTSTHIPSVTLVNTKLASVDQPGNANDLVRYDETIASIVPFNTTVQLCASNPCTAIPFNGTCTNRPNNSGVLCSFKCTNSLGQRVSKAVTSTMLPPSNSCPTIGCPPGKFGDTIKTSNLTVACKSCPSGRFGDITVGHPVTNMSIACKFLCPRGRYGILTGQIISEESPCRSCPAGKYGDIAGGANESHGCPVLCASGRYGNATGKTNESEACRFLCVSGRYGNLTGQANACPYECPSGRYGNVTGQSSKETACSNTCSPGKYGAAVGRTTEEEACPSLCSMGKYGNASGKASAADACRFLCPPGRFGNLTGQSNQHLACPFACPAGRFGDLGGKRNKSSACPNTWKTCHPGQYVTKNGTSTRDQGCETCGLGQYSSLRNVGNCTVCPSGQYTVAGGSRERSICSTCPEGKYLEDPTGVDKCKNCPEGRYNDDLATSHEEHDSLEDCIKCDAGRYSPSTGLAVACGCQLCGKGTVQPFEGNSSCVSCPSGKYQPDMGERVCLPCASVSANGTVCTSSPPPRPVLTFIGKTRIGVAWDGLLAESPEATSFTVEWSGVEGFRPLDGRATSANASMVIDTVSSVIQTVTYVRVRSTGGQWSLPSAAWITADRCNDDSFLGTSNQMADWACEACPEGGYCAGGNVTWTEVKAQFGWWRQRPYPEKSNFSRCLFPPACLGAPNRQGSDLNKQYPTDVYIRTAASAERCNSPHGYRAGSRLCADCMPGYSRNGQGQCKKCAENGLNVIFPIIVVLAMIGFVIFLVWSTVVKRLGTQGTFHESDGAKKIFISYLQLTASVTAMDIPWPANYVAVFKAQALASSVGEEFIDVRCAMTDPATIASIEYGKVLVYALLPIILVCLSAGFWVYCGRCLNIPRAKRNATMTGTIVLLLYLLYPSITAKTLGLWKCHEMEGIGSIFVVDPEVLCDSRVHRLWQNAVGVPCILLYIIGLPLFAIILLYRFRHKLLEPNTCIRFGLLYDGFKTESYMHEFFVVLRKVLIIVIAIFEDKVQVLLCLGVVGMLLTHTVMTRPFQTEFLTRLEIFLLSCSFLTLWVGGIFVVYPGCHADARGHMNTICVVGEVSVLAMNIVCLIVGLASYVWLSWKENRKVAIRAGKKQIAAVCSWAVCKRCCKNEFGIRMRSSDVKWTNNPAVKGAANKGVELPVVRMEKVMDAMSAAELVALVKKERLQKDALEADILKLRRKVSDFEGNISGAFNKRFARSTSKELKTMQQKVQENRLQRLTTLAQKKQTLTKKNTETFEPEKEEIGEESTWFSLVDEESGHLYYCNKNTNEVQWDRPELMNT